MRDSISQFVWILKRRCDGVSAMPRRCIFCGGTPLTKEHAIPSWVSDCLPGEGVFTQRRESGAQWETQALQITVKRACLNCNTGWMSRLEGRAGSLLREPLAGKTQRWSPTEQRRVATWMFKTALMMSLSCGGSRVPSEHYKFLQKNLRPPGHCRVWVTSFGINPPSDTFEVGWIQPSWLTFEGVKTGHLVHGYAITCNIGYLAFQVLGYEGREKLQFSERVIYGIGLDRYNTEIWPPQGHPVQWPPPVGFDRAGLVEYAGRWATSRTLLKR